MDQFAVPTPPSGELQQQLDDALTRIERYKHAIERTKSASRTKDATSAYVTHFKSSFVIEIYQFNPICRQNAGSVLAAVGFGD